MTQAPCWECATNRRTALRALVLVGVLAAHALIAYFVFRVPTTVPLAARTIAVVVLPVAPHLSSVHLDTKVAVGSVGAVPNVSLPTVDSLIVTASANASGEDSHMTEKQALERLRSPDASEAPPTETRQSSADLSGPHTWESELLLWIRGHKFYPPSARERHQEGSVSLQFVVSRDGRVRAVHILRGSGYLSLDSAARQLLDAATVPPFPDSMLQSEMTVRITLDYSLDT